MKTLLVFLPLPSIECLAKVQSKEIVEVLTFPKPTHSYIGLGWPLGCGEFIVTLNALNFSRLHPKVRIFHLFKSRLAKSSFKDFCKMRSHRTYNDIKNRGVLYDREVIKVKNFMTGPSFKSLCSSQKRKPHTNT